MFPKRATRKWTLSFQFCNQNSLQSFISYRIISGLITIIIWKFERGSRQYCSYCRLNGTKLLFQYYADQKLWHTSTGSDSQIHISWNTPTSNSAGKNQIRNFKKMSISTFILKQILHTQEMLLFQRREKTFHITLLNKSFCPADSYLFMLQM